MTSSILGPGLRCSRPPGSFSDWPREWVRLGMGLPLRKYKSLQPREQTLSCLKPLLGIKWLSGWMFGFVWDILKDMTRHGAGWLFDSGDRPQNYEIIQVVEIFPKCVGRRLEDEIDAPETSNGSNPSAPNRLGSMSCKVQFTHASSSYIDASMIHSDNTHSYKYLYMIYKY